MKHRYELLNVETSNLIGTYLDQGSALDVIRAMIDIHGAEQIRDVGLARFTLRGDIRPIAEGDELVALAQSEQPGPPTGRRAHPRRAGVRVRAARGRTARRVSVAV